MVEPRSVQWIGEKHVLRCIAGSMDYGMNYVRGDRVSLVGYTNSDGQDVLLTGRAPQVVVLGWVQDLFLGTFGNRSQLL
jgi:hypothetical protein